MDKVKIKNESLPIRCDICHQADEFDPYLNQCNRCTNVKNSIIPFNLKYITDFESLRNTSDRNGEQHNNNNNEINNDQVKILNLISEWINIGVRSGLIVSVISMIVYFNLYFLLSIFI